MSDDPSDSDSSGFSPAPRRWWPPALAVVIAAIAYAVFSNSWLFLGNKRFRGDRAFEKLTTLVGFGPRSHGSPGAEQAQKWIAAQLQPLRGTCRWFRFEAKEQPSRAGTASSTGSFATATFLLRPHMPYRLALITHWDTPHHADATTPPAKEPVPGANDGGSGTALLLQLAEQLSQDENLPFGVDIIFFDGEENGTKEHPEGYCTGSRWLADRLEQRLGHRPLAVIDIDMVGDRDLDIYEEISSMAAARAWTQTIFQRAADLGLKGFHSSSKWSILDDHTPFQELGIPATLLIDYDYPPWHTPTDTLERCSEESLQQVGDLLLDLCRDRSLLRPLIKTSR